MTKKEHEAEGANLHVNKKKSKNGVRPFINIPASEIPVKRPKTRKDFRDSMQWRIFRIMAEFVDGFQFINDYKKTVTFFGSARMDEKNEHYRQTRALASELSKAGYGIVTGGGPGIMEAANRGAVEANGESIGLNIQIPSQERRNPYVVNGVGFHYFFTRKVMLSFAAEAYIFCPGGFGTLDEFFEMITLVQTKKIPHLPIILFGVDFWKPLVEYLDTTVRKGYGAIRSDELELFTMTDDIEKIVEIIKKAPPREG